MKRDEELEQRCDSLIRAGRLAEARVLLRDLNSAKIPKALRLSFATLCRRTRLLNRGLKILAPLVYPERGKWRTTATVKEIAEYALLLQRSGVDEEAMALLESTPTGQPEALFAKASVFVSRWDYEAALPLLQHHAESLESKYARLVADMNVAAALNMVGQVDQALALINDCAARASESQNWRVRANSVELRAQIRIARQEFSAAAGDLEEAAKLLGSSGTNDRLFVDKWLAVCESMKSRDPAAIWKFREAAQVAGEWESVREADFYALKVKFDERTFQRLMFGTPYPSYRRLVSRALNKDVSCAFFLLGEDHQGVLEVATGTFTGRGTPVNPGKKIHHVLDVLSRDLYSPLRVAGLFAQLYPSERFDVFSSPHRVRAAVYRCRQHLAEFLPSITIEETRGRYRLQVGKGIGLRLRYERSTVDGHHARLAKLLELIPGEASLSAVTIRGALGLSLTSGNRFLNWGLEQGIVEKIGQGRSTRYRIKALRDAA